MTPAKLNETVSAFVANTARRKQLLINLYESATIGGRSLKKPQQIEREVRKVRDVYYREIRRFGDPRDIEDALMVRLHEQISSDTQALRLVFEGYRKPSQLFAATQPSTGIAPAEAPPPKPEKKAEAAPREVDYLLTMVFMSLLRSVATESCHSTEHTLHKHCRGCNLSGPEEESISNYLDQLCQVHGLEPPNLTALGNSSDDDIPF